MLKKTKKTYNDSLFFITLHSNYYRIKLYPKYIFIILQPKTIIWSLFKSNYAEKLFINIISFTD